MRPGNSSKPVHPIDVHKSIGPANFHKPVYPTDVCKSLRPIDICKPLCLVDICNPYFVDYWRDVIFSVSLNTSLFNRTVLYMIIHINIHIIYLIFTKIFKCTYII